MGQLFSYSLSSAIILIILYVIYKPASALGQSSANRRVSMLAMIILSFVLPAVHFGNIFTLSPTATGAIDIEGATMAISPVAGTQSVVHFAEAALLIYIAGVALLSLTLIFRILMLCFVIHRGDAERHDGYRIVRIDKRIAPFSWLRTIILDKRENGTDLEMIKAHELKHISSCHSVDLLLANLLCILQWYNPVAWIARRELSLAHEYEADSAVIGQGYDPQEYQLMLIKKAAGPRFQSLTSSLNHSKLKKRITMMCKTKRKSRGILTTLVLAPAIIAAVTVVNIPAVAKVIDSAAVTNAPDNVPDKVTTKSPNEVIAMAIPLPDANSKAVPPEYPGGEKAMFEYLMMNIHYPAEAEKAKKEGRVIVSFDIDTDGSVINAKVMREIDPVLDKEAVRVISTMPKWIPATVDGKPVKVSYALPVSFKLK